MTGFFFLNHWKHVIFLKGRKEDPGRYWLAILASVPSGTENEADPPGSYRGIWMTGEGMKEASNMGSHGENHA